MATQTPIEATETQQGRHKRYRRNLFTGELEQVQDNPIEEFQEIRKKHAGNYRHFVTKRRGDPWDTGRLHRCRSISLKAEDATPERIARENEQAKRHGTGAQYAPDGTCYVPTRGSRAKELRRKSIDNQASGGQARIIDLDAGYSDFAGR